MVKLNPAEARPGTRAGIEQRHCIQDAMEIAGIPALDSVCNGSSQTSFSYIHFRDPKHRTCRTPRRRSPQTPVELSIKNA